MKHDQLWKEIIGWFFRLFMEFFLPDIAERIDFGAKRKLNKELFTKSSSWRGSGYAQLPVEANAQ